MIDFNLQELDTWLAENLMDWHKEYCEVYPNVSTDPNHVNWKQFYWLDKIGNLKHLVSEWHPTQDGRHMLEIMEKIRKEDYLINLYSDPDGDYVAQLLTKEKN